MMKQLVLIAVCLIIESAASQLKILHYNDNHARIEAQDITFNACNVPDTCFGGFAKQQTIINQERANAQANGTDFILVHAGDQFSGTFWDIIFTSKGNFSATTPFLRAQKIDAFTFGNHEFDYGPGILASFLNSSKLPITSCNVDISKEPAFNGINIPRFIIKTLPISGIKVGFIAFTAVDSNVTSRPGPNIIFSQPTDVAPKCIQDAKAAGATLIVAVSHLGYQVDQQFAADPSAAGINLIIGAHSHSFLYNGNPPVLIKEPPKITNSTSTLNSTEITNTTLSAPITTDTTEIDGPYPTFVNNIPIVQCSWASRYMGSLDIQTDGSSIQSISGEPILLGGAASSNNVKDDPITSAAINRLKKPLNAYLKTAVGTTLVLLDGDRDNVRNEETNLGDLLNDAMIWYMTTNTSALTQPEYANLPVVSVYNGGGIRASIEPGNVTNNEILTVLPNSNVIATKIVNSTELLSDLDNGVSLWTGETTSGGRFLQVGGMRYAFDPSLPVGSRIVSAAIKKGDSYVDLKSYPGNILLLTSDYIAGGNEGFVNIGAATVPSIDSSTPINDILAAYVQAISPISTTVDGRIVNCAQNATNVACHAQLSMLPPAMAPAMSGSSSLSFTAVLMTCLLLLLL